MFVMTTSATLAIAEPAPQSSDETPTSEEATTPAEGEPLGADASIDLRLRSLEKRVHSLKQRAWQTKARIGALKQAVLGGGIGARTQIVYINEMGSKFKLNRLVISLDGTQIFVSADRSGRLDRQRRIEAHNAPITPGAHTLTVVAVFRGYGFGVFRYFDDYKFTVRASHSLTIEEGLGTEVRIRSFEKGGITTPVRDRPAIDFKVGAMQPGQK